MPKVEAKRARRGLMVQAGAPLRPRNRQRGFTIVELLIVVAIMITIAAIAVPNLLAALDYARVGRAVGDIRTISFSVQTYAVSNDNSFPNTLNDVGYGDLLDPWSNPYQYMNFATLSGSGQMRKDRFLVPVNSYFDLYSMGKDGQTATPLTAAVSQDDIIYANDGAYIGLASEY